MSGARAFGVASPIARLVAAVLLWGTLLPSVESALAHPDEDYFDYWQDLSQR